MIRRPGQAPAVAAGADSDIAVPAGQILGPWQLERRVGVGQWTYVFQARPIGRDPSEPADYAVKCLKPEFESRHEYLQLLQRENQVGRQVTHRHLAPVLAASLKQPPFWIAMPLVVGESLEARLTLRRRLPCPYALWIARQIAEALDALHRAGWMHGDVKPHNILVAPQGHATLIDLGFARPLAPATGSPDADHALEILTATPAYAAPETFLERPRFEPASDNYSLGVTLFEGLTGRRPFTATNLIVLADSHLRQAPPDVRQFVPDIPPKVADLVWQLLAKDPRSRPSGERLLDQLVSLEIETFQRIVA